MIGIIGGNGVAATNKLLQLIEEKITKNGAFRDCHHPEMIAWQATQAPLVVCIWKDEVSRFLMTIFESGNI